MKRKIKILILFLFINIMIFGGESRAVSPEKIVYKNEINVSDISLSDFIFFLSKSKNLTLRLLA